MAERLVQAFKVCRKCGLSKPATAEFFVRKLAGFASRCKPCLQGAKRRDWARKSAGINAARRAVRGEETRRKDRAYYAANAERKRANDRKRHAANPDRRRERDRRHYVRYAEKKKLQAKEWAACNPERRRTNVREFYRRKRATDPMYRLRSSVSAYVYWCLKGNNRGRTERLLGYSIANLKTHLERQFAKGMTWDNYGDWHVDHILPVSGFSFTSPDDADFKACWAITNLRPMWAADNIRKSDKRLHLI